MTASRDRMIDAFLARAGWADAARADLAGDASNRRYLRLRRGRETAILMDAPPDRGEDIRPFTAMSRWLLARGLSAPRTIAEDLEAGLLLLEDLGDDLFARHLEAAPDDEERLYQTAVDLLVGIAVHGPAPHLAPYDRAILDREAALFTEWWMGPDTSAGARQDYADLVQQATAPVAENRSVTVLRDYHAENLLWLPGRTGHARVGLLDYQDALAGHPAYDLVSLLEDARRDTARALQERMIGRYLAARPELDAGRFRADYAVLGAQRNLKIVGIFARLARRDGKLRYLSLIPRVWEHLRHDLAHPDLAELRAWIERHAPPPDEQRLTTIAAELAS